MEKYHALMTYAPDSLDSLAPLEIVDDLHAMNMAFVERYGINNLTDKWNDSQGIYLLFSHIKPGHKFEAYVGQTISGFHKRLIHHDKTKSFWDTAILARRNTPEGFTSLHLNALEGRLDSILKQSSNVHVYNEYPTGDRTLRDIDESFIDGITLSIMRAMFLRGYRNQHMGAEADRLNLSVKGEETQTLPSEQDNNPKFDALKEWRYKQAVAENRTRAVYLIFDNKTLENILLSNPKTYEELLMTPGVGPVKGAKYGKEILRILND